MTNTTPKPLSNEEILKAKIDKVENLLDKGNLIQVPEDIAWEMGAVQDNTVTLEEAIEASLEPDFSIYDDEE